MSIDRRTALKSALAAGLAAAGGAAAAETKTDARRASPKRYAMKKSINLWAFPYPQQMTLTECLQLAKNAGFDGIELNYDLENDLSPKSGPKEFQAIRKTAEQIGIAISGVCSFLFWKFAFTSNDPAQRRAVSSWRPRWPTLHTTSAPRTCCACRVPSTFPGTLITSRCRTTSATSARGKPSRKLIPTAEKLGVYLNIENIFFNGYLMTPAEMNAFVDSFQSK